MSNPRLTQDQDWSEGKSGSESRLRSRAPPTPVLASSTYQADNQGYIRDSPRRIMVWTPAVWQAHHDPFGQANVTIQAVVNNLRLPGQYFDAETGLHYNYFRNYDSDPIGFGGGDQYLYVC
jgi:RHS repeat-associated protein